MAERGRICEILFGYISRVSCSIESGARVLGAAASVLVGFSARVRAGAMVQCALCHNAPATVFCLNDNAQLCTGCDVQIHKTNKLTWRHQRVHLCEMCEGNPRHAVVFCAQDKVR